jgi:HSP20 family protein
MPAIIRKSTPVIVENRREFHGTVTWQVRPNVWRPPTDVYDTAESVIVKMEIAGMRDEDIEVAVQDEILMVSGNRSDSLERKAYHQMEIPFGKFSVVIELPAQVAIDHATVEYRDGFLTIRLPKEK